MAADWIVLAGGVVWAVMDQAYAYLMVQRRQRLLVGFHPCATARSRLACLRAFVLVVPFALTLPPWLTRYLPPLVFRILTGTVRLPSVHEPLF